MMDKKAQKSDINWQSEDYLFPPLNKEAQDILLNFPAILNEVWPLKKTHREKLPTDIAELSKLLTSNRGELPDLPYWSKPGFVSAYLYYFLPWNLIRLIRVIQGLPLLKPVEKDGLDPVLYDIGSGPFTLILALWIAKPEWRQLPLHVLALDKSVQSLQLGAKLFEALAGQSKALPWPHKYVRASVWALPGHVRSWSNGYPWIIASINVLNEIIGNKKIAEEDLLEKLLTDWESVYQNKNTNLLFIEPGTRQGGAIIMQLRQLALNSGLYVSAPCTHNNSCPLLKKKNTFSSYSKSWCHFTFAASDVPHWLTSLSHQAGLEKQSLSLSPLFLSVNRPSHRNQARVISQSFKTGNDNNSRYVCADCGLGLIINAQNILAGSIIETQPTKRRDLKSKAIILEPCGKSSFRSFSRKRP